MQLNVQNLVKTNFRYLQMGSLHGSQGTLTITDIPFLDLSI